MYEVLSPEYIVEGETSNNTPELKNDTVVMCGTESDFTPFDISLFYEASLQSYVRYGHISPKTTLEEWKDTREDIRSYYVMIRNGNNLIAGAKLIQNIDFLPKSPSVFGNLDKYIQNLPHLFLNVP